VPGLPLRLTDEVAVGDRPLQAVVVVVVVAGIPRRLAPPPGPPTLVPVGGGDADEPLRPAASLQCDCGTL